VAWLTTRYGRGMVSMLPIRFARVAPYAVCEAVDEAADVTGISGPHQCEPHLGTAAMQRFTVASDDCSRGRETLEYTCPNFR
jgi:hypothetical protein